MAFVAGPVGPLLNVLLIVASALVTIALGWASFVSPAAVLAVWGVWAVLAAG